MKQRLLNYLTALGLIIAGTLIVQPTWAQQAGNAIVNLRQLNGTTIDTNSGNKSAGTLRMVLATDQPALTNKLLVTPDGTGSTGSAVPAAAFYSAGINHSGNLVGDVICDQQAVYDASTNGSTQLVAISGSTHIYICGYAIVVGGTATNMKLTAGTGSNCGSAISGTPSTGSTGANAALTPAWPLTANEGISQMFPRGTVIDSGSANAVCVNASAGNAATALLFYSQR